MAKKKRTAEEAPRRQTRKEILLATRQRERDRKFLLLGGAATGFALLLVLIGAVYSFLIVPSRLVVSVNGHDITVQDFRNRYRYERQLALNRYETMRMLQQQFAGQVNFLNEIQVLQTALSDEFTMGVRVKSTMIEDLLIADAAREAGLSVSEAQLDELVEAEVAARYSKYTAAQATATITAREASAAEQAADAGDDAAGADSGPAAEPIDIISEEELRQGTAGLAEELDDTNGLTLADYRQILKYGLLREMVRSHVTEGNVETTEPRIRARHILITFDNQAGGEESDSEGRTEAEALALAESLVSRLELGESFDYLVDLYSDDPTAQFNQGDLGWFAKGRMVPSFEEAAFALAVDDTSAPVATEFGYHIIQVTDSDPEAPISADALASALDEYFRTWLVEQQAAADIVEQGLVSDQIPVGASKETEEFRNSLGGQSG